MATKLEAFWLSVQSVMQGREPHPGVSLKGEATSKVPLPASDFSTFDATDIALLNTAVMSGVLVDADSTDAEKKTFISRVALKAFEDAFTNSGRFKQDLFQEYLKLGGTFSAVSVDFTAVSGLSGNHIFDWISEYQKVEKTGKIADAESIPILLSGFYSGNQNLKDFSIVLDALLASTDSEIREHPHAKQEFYPEFLNERPDLIGLCSVSNWPRSNVSQKLLNKIAELPADTQKRYLNKASQTVRKRFYAKRDLSELSALLPDDWTDATILKEYKKGHSVAKFYLDALLREHLPNGAMRKLAYELFDSQPEMPIELTIASLA